ncbi:MAG: RNA-guided endonuclease InsQ/TnpB family protein [Candidatus Hodarchaeota archaeon]
MILTYRFRMYPKKEEEQKLIWTLNKCRFVYNKLLEELNRQEKISKNDLQHSIVELKKEFPELKDVYSKVLQYENHKLFSNLRALAKTKKNGRKVGKLRFKSKNSFKTFTYNQTGFRIIEKQTRSVELHLSKIGRILTIKHRTIKGKIKQITIKRYPSQKWYALVAVENKMEVPRKQNTRRVGIDLGIINYVYDSDGNHFDNPKSLDNSLKKLKKRQKRLSMKKKESKNWFKQKIEVARVHEKIVNQRDDFLHKLSNYYTKNYRFIAVENLDVRGLIRLSYSARNIVDASWSKFTLMLHYKAERAGCVFLKVDPEGTTQTCSSCGKKIKKQLWERIHMCGCGLEIDRDHNSAINILKRALGQELPEFTPAETGPLPARASSVNETGSSLQ